MYLDSSKINSALETWNSKENTQSNFGDNGHSGVLSSLWRKILDLAPTKKQSPEEEAQLNNVKASTDKSLVAVETDAKLDSLAATGGTKAVELWEDEPALAKADQDFERSRDVLAQGRTETTSDNPEPSPAKKKAIWKEILEEHTTQDEKTGMRQLKKMTLRDWLEIPEEVGTVRFFFSKEFWLGRVFSFDFWKRSLRQRAERKGVKASLDVINLKAYYQNKYQEKLDRIKKRAKEAAATAKTGLNANRTAKIEMTPAYLAAQKTMSVLLKKSSAQAKDALSSLSNTKATLSTKRFVLKTIANDTSKKIWQKFKHQPKVLEHFIKKNPQLGIKLRGFTTAARSMELTTRMWNWVWTSKEERSGSGLLSEASKVLPIWGTIASFKDSEGYPPWARWLMIGGSVALDIATVAGSVGTFGAGTPFAVGGRMAAGASLRAVVTKLAGKSTAAQAQPKIAIQAAAKKTKQAIKNSSRHGFVKNTGKGIAYGMGAVAVSEAVEGLFPAGIIMEVALNQGSKALEAEIAGMNPAQQKLAREALSQAGVALS